MSVASDLVPMYSRGPAAGGGKGGELRARRGRGSTDVVAVRVAGALPSNLMRRIRTTHTEVRGGGGWRSCARAWTGSR